MFTVRLAGEILEIVVYLAVAGGVFGNVLFCAVLFFPRDVSHEIWD